MRRAGFNGVATTIVVLGGLALLWLRAFLGA